MKRVQVKDEFKQYMARMGALLSKIRFRYFKKISSYKKCFLYGSV